MPNMNGNGPSGLGAGTGRGWGPCGKGMAYGRQGVKRDRGFGWRRFWGYYPVAAPSKKEESEVLTEEEGILEEELKAIKSRLAQLKGQK